MSVTVLPAKKGRRPALDMGDAELPASKRKSIRPGGSAGNRGVEATALSLDQRRSNSSNRALISLLQVLILGLTGVMANQQFAGADKVSSGIYAYLSWLPILVRGLILATVAMLAQCFALYQKDLYEAWVKTPSPMLLAVHLGLAVLQFSVTAVAPPLMATNAPEHSGWLLYYAAAPLLWAGYLLSGFAVLVPGWRSSLRPIRLRAASVGAFVILCYGSWRIFERLGYPSSRSFTQATMTVTSWISNGLGHPLVFVKIVDETPVYRSGHFTAFIFPGCSGLEGMVLIVGLLLAGIALEWRRLRIGLAMALVAAAALCAFLMNALRISALFYIGDRWSPEIAEYGFHANFGVASFVAITSVFFLAIHRYADTGRIAADGKSTLRSDAPKLPPIRYAYPLMGLLAATLVVGLFSGKFNWLYPVSMLLGAGLLMRLRLPDVEPDWKIGLAPLVAGGAVSYVWINLVANDIEASAAFAQTLSDAPPIAATLWLIARFAGSILVAPMAEELTFRAFLLPWLVNRLALHLPRALLVPAALALTSIAFGLMHVEVLAGSVAGLTYGLVYLRRRSAHDAILAHACSNFVLCAYILSTHEWSYL